MFDIQNEKLQIDIYLEDGDYNMVLYDIYGDGGLLGEICNNDNKLCDIQFTTGKQATYPFTIKTQVSVQTQSIKIELIGDIYSHIESSWNIKNSHGVFLFDNHLTFTRTNKNHIKELKLLRGEYSVVLFDKWTNGHKKIYTFTIR